MEYERIHKVQMGVISPSKLRMKLLGSHGARKKEGTTNSSRASPSQLPDMEYAKNSLLAGDLDEEVSSKVSRDVLAHGQDNQTHSSQKDMLSKEKSDSGHKIQTAAKGVSYQKQPSNNLSTVHPVKSSEEDVVGYDSGHDSGYTSSFEFHGGDRTLLHAAAGPFQRQVSSKWNDAEKWLVNKKMTNPSLNAVKKAVAHNQGSRQVIPNGVRVAPESLTAEQKHCFSQGSDTKRLSSTSHTSKSVDEKFSFAPNCLQSSADSADGMNGSTNLAPVSSSYGSVHGAQKEHNHITPYVQSVSMRDVGTEMTPIPSQEPSRTGTPLGATTPMLTPLSSIPSSPKRGPAPTPAEVNAELSARELQLKTRKEIAALGVQLGKVKIATWASKDDSGHASPSSRPFDVDQLVKADYEARAAGWEKSQKSRHIARYKHEEIKIQTWEIRQREKYETKMRRVEARVERIKARAQEKMVEKLAITRQRVEEKQATAEARKERRAVRTAKQVDRIRQTGRVPSSRLECCGWFL